MFRCSRFYWINWHEKYIMYGSKFLVFYISNIPHIFYYLLNKIFIHVFKAKYSGYRARESSPIKRHFSLLLFDRFHSQWKEKKTSSLTSKCIQLWQKLHNQTPFYPHFLACSMSYKKLSSEKRICSASLRTHVFSFRKTREKNYKVWSFYHLFNKNSRSKNT